MKKEYGPLYARSSTGKVKIWKALVVDGQFTIEHGYQNGKMASESREVKIKNIGKANETTPFQQACNEAQSHYNEKVDKGYTTSLKKIDSKGDTILPMLAYNWNDRKKDIVYPAFCQPKLNGIRCIQRNGTYQSRLGKFWDSLHHLDSNILELRKSLGSVPLDGEIYIHGLHLQDIGALIKKERIDENIEGYKTEDLEYWIFDIIDDKMNFADRSEKLRTAFEKAGESSGNCMKLGNLVFVKDQIVTSEDHVNSMHKEYIAADMEGTIVRNNVPYVIGHRTKHLLKKKDFIDAEYEIIGGKSGEGRYEGCCTFICMTKDGDPFDCVPIGTIKKKKEYLKNIKSLITKMATVRLQEYTKSGTPFHGRVLCIRDYE